MRKDYITAKYTEKRFAKRLFSDAELRLQALYEAVRNRDILSLIQVYAEGVDLMEVLPQTNEHVRSPSSPSCRLGILSSFCSASGSGCESGHVCVSHAAGIVSVRNLGRRCSTWRSEWWTGTLCTSWTFWLRTGEVRRCSWRLPV